MNVRRNVAAGERGQAFVLTIVFLACLMGMAALVLDVGHWYRAKRDLQAVADSAALAGAQALPDNTALATALATQYSKDNGGPTPEVVFTSKNLANDTITVRVKRAEPGFFSKIFSIDSVDIGSRAMARTGQVVAAQYAAPFGIDKKQAELLCSPIPCTNPTDLDLEKVGPGAFRILNIDGSSGGTGTQILGDWVLRGFDGMMPVNEWYYSDPGAKFNSSNVSSALSIRLGDELMFPVYDQITGNGANLQYHVIGWAGFVVTAFTGNGNKGNLQGHFTKFLAQGLQGMPNNPSFGTYTVQLVE
jgi:hypothetical protein